jgi:hypothetical protein
LNWCFCMVVQCSRTMLDKLLSAGWYVMTNGTLLFAFFSLYWMRSFLSIPELTSPLDLPTMISVKNVIRDDVWRAKTSNAHKNSAAHIQEKKSSYTAMPTASAHERCWINYWAQDGMWWQMALCCSRSFLYIGWGLFWQYHLLC